MAKRNLDNIGSWTALVIGLPIGLLFAFAVLYTSLFPMLDFGLAVIGGKLFWHPIIWGGIFPICFGLLLWIAGKRIKGQLDKNISTLKTSYLFTFFVNSWLFGLILTIFIIGGFFFNITEKSSFFNISFFAIGLTILAFFISTALTTVTIGMLIVTITRNIISVRRNKLRD